VWLELGEVFEVQNNRYGLLEVKNSHWRGV
jgi:hypothetical protein